MKKMISVLLVLMTTVMFQACEESSYSLEYFRTMERVDKLITLGQNDVYLDINGNPLDVKSFTAVSQRDLYPPGLVNEYYVKHLDGTIEHIIEEIEHRPVMLYALTHPRRYVLEQLHYDENNIVTHITYQEIGDGFLKKFWMDTE